MKGNAMLYLVDNMSREIERLRYPEEPHRHGGGRL